MYYVLAEIVFGPVPSRRLGRSLGINNLPRKICSYSCIYCQAGRTIELSISRKEFYCPYYLEKIVRNRVKRLKRISERIDYITFVPNGEPTLDENIGFEARLLKDLGIPIAVLTNGSLLWMEDVRNDLLEFDYVSIKIDSVSENLWRYINRPHHDLRLEKILDGIFEFRNIYHGKLVTETMLIDNIDYGNELTFIAEYLGELKPDIAYISIPTRPPAEKWVKPPKEDLLNNAYQLFSERIDRVELLIGFEGTNFTTLDLDHISREILSIACVHPLREDVLEAMLKRSGVTWDVVNELIERGELIEVYYSGYRYYLRRVMK